MNPHPFDCFAYPHTFGFSHYQTEALKTAIYPEAAKVLYPAMLLASEAGEVAGKIQKHIRKGDDLSRLSPEAKEAIQAEVGDVLWACAALLSDLGLGMGGTALKNLEKLASRKARGVLEGAGDNR